MRRSGVQRCPATPHNTGQFVAGVHAGEDYSYGDEAFLGFDIDEYGSCLPSSAFGAQWQDDADEAARMEADGDEAEADAVVVTAGEARTQHDTAALAMR